MDFIGYPLAFAMGSVYLTNRVLYKKYFNKVKSVNPFNQMLKTNSKYLQKGRF